MNGIASGTALWYTSRATGVVALGLLTLVMVLGIVVNRQGRLPGLPRFGATSLHRSVSLLAVAFVGLHVATAIADPYVSIGLAAAIVPFASHYEPFWLGLGAVALDLMAALIITSLLRGRIGRRTWRAVHWAAYATWPVAFAHSIGASTDMQSGPLLDAGIGCAAAVAAALAWRIASSRLAPAGAHRAARILASAESRTSSGQRSPVTHGSGQHGSGQHGSGQHGSGQHGSGQHGSGQHGPGRRTAAPGTPRPDRAHQRITAGNR
jgi:predicted ferric reductase